MLFHQTSLPPDDLETSVPPKVLVVEDEMMLRMRAVDIVEDAGFTPIEAVNADEALAILEIPLRYRAAVYGHSNARQHGRPQAGSRRPWAVAIR